MPEKKGSRSKTGDKSKTGDTYKVKNKNSKEGAAKKSSAQKKADELREMRRNSLSAQLSPYLLAILAILLGVFIYLESLSGSVGGAIGAFFKGIFAGGALIVPPVVILLAIRWRKDAEERQNGVRVACAFGVVFLLSTLLHITVKGTLTFNIGTLYSEGLTLKGGGFIGGVIGTLLWNCFRIAAPIMIVAGLIVLVPMMFGLTPRGVYVLIAYKLKMAKERHDEAADEREVLRRDREERARREREAGVVGYGKYTDEKAADRQLSFDEDKAPTHRKKRGKEDFEPDVPMPDGDKYEDIAPEVDESIFDDAMQEQAEEIDGILDGKISDKIDGYTPDNSGSAGTDRRDDPIPDKDQLISELAEAVGDDGAPWDDPDEKVDLGKIFSEPGDAELLDKLVAAYMTDETDAEADLAVKRETVSTPAEEEDEPEEPVTEPYRFPPLELLSPDDSGKDPAVREELKENAVKLVETLRSFNVKTKIVDVCRGPTITRYELMPESGTKVRTIANLTDDIALAFAAKGVRIEAPVPGKSAVGIEVPNKNSSFVYLRTLLDDPRFTDAKSKLNVALGANVAGEAVYLDIVKMPHLLIAGATGMGKSVCINCIIVSLLYKANPDEVKLILVDPKKVEFSLYEGLPHLLVPVVSDPKKAAGSLSWAVSEMERRFTILENARVRDIAKYNEVAKVQGLDVMPQIVIIIDELADLMMTASDDVEKSIARLAQKARAAGMHLIIGTQRPDVSVITGLIKNNIPSRISCAVTSQVDSRTVLDRAGAEKLIGRGDMLYKPVGIDPIRVQGAFVTEEEVEAVVEFIKSQNTGKTEGYNEEVIEQIEREAEMCGVTGKKKTAIDAADDDGEDDPMLRAALELAVESRKISTSLIQRKLSLGYGRAAKLIDRMEQLGYVSPPDGQKPREVLISKQEFMEMVLKDTD